MIDTATIAASLTSLKAIYDLLKGTNDAQLAIKVSLEVSNIQSQLIDLQQQSLSIQAENQELRNETNKYKSYNQHHSVTWRQKPDGTEDGPYCPACFGEGRDMPLIPIQHTDRNLTDWLVYCPRGHTAPKAKSQGFLPPKQEPIYRIPKGIVSPDRFYQAGAQAPIG